MRSAPGAITGHFPGCADREGLGWPLIKPSSLQAAFSWPGLALPWFRPTGRGCKARNLWIPTEFRLRSLMGASAGRHTPTQKSPLFRRITLPTTEGPQARGVWGRPRKWHLGSPWGGQHQLPPPLHVHAAHNRSSSCFRGSCVACGSWPAWGKSRPLLASLGGGFCVQRDQLGGEQLQGHLPKNRIKLRHTRSQPSPARLRSIAISFQDITHKKPSWSGSRNLATAPGLQ